MKKLFILNFFILAGILFFSCKKERQDDTPFSIKAVYDSIGSSPGGGGIFIVSLVDSLNTSGDIELTLDASSKLNASLSRTKVSKAFPVTELTIKPGKDIPIGKQTIKLNASNATSKKTIQLSVGIIDWEYEPGETPIAKKDEYILWLQKNYSDIKITPSSQWFGFLTYPGILIVEHITLLNDDYEFKICTHAMIHPYNWSMIRLRKRNEVNPFFAARQDSSDGAFYQIPVNDYPKWEY